MRTPHETERLKIMGENIRRIRISCGYNQTEFANMIGKDQPSINRLESGKINPSFLFLDKVAEGLNVPVSLFFEPK